MKKLLLVIGVCSVLAGCAFHSKQPIDDNYYKKTQSIEWPDEQSGSAVSTSTSKKTAVPAAVSGTSAKKDDLNWQTAKPYEQKAQEQKEKMAVPAAPEIKLECARISGNSYKCRYGAEVCGSGCKADGSNCLSGYCLPSDCDDVMGQKWELVKVGSYYACKHPDYPVSCRPDGTSGIACRRDSTSCGSRCNANGTLCEWGANDCWDGYR